MDPWAADQVRQKEIAALATRELLAIARRHRSMEIEQFGEVYQGLVDKYGQLSADSAMRAITEAREATGRLEILPPVRAGREVPIAQVRSSFRWAVSRAIVRDPMTVARVLAGPLGRLVRQRGRETVWDNTVAAGTRYARLPGPRACDFCLMLASRGAVYTRETALTVGRHADGRRRSRRPEGLRYHDNCDCTAIESHSDEDLPQIIRDLQDEWAEVTYRADGQPFDDQRGVWRAHIRRTRPNHETRRPRRAGVFDRGTHAVRGTVFEDGPDNVVLAATGNLPERRLRNLYGVPVREFPRLKQPETLRQAAREVSRVRGKENCVRAVHAAAMRAKGYDIYPYVTMYSSGKSGYQAVHSLKMWHRMNRPVGVETMKGASAYEALAQMPSGSWGAISSNIEGTLIRHIWLWSREGDSTIYIDPQGGGVLESPYQLQPDAITFIARLDDSSVVSSMVQDVVMPFASEEV